MKLKSKTVDKANDYLKSNFFPRDTIYAYARMQQIFIMGTGFENHSEAYKHPESKFDKSLR
eukprot:GAHX01001907.1.p3 GENE.GAHX01001907.1~~GAHX01001907.1.p3  ORF type:complete len:61 (+),score=8.99 GAHX01001907.1:321-503(+)